MQRPYSPAASRHTPTLIPSRKWPLSAPAEQEASQVPPKVTAKPPRAAAPQGQRRLVGWAERKYPSSV